MKARFSSVLKPSEKSFAQVELPPQAVAALKLDGHRLRVHGTVDYFSFSEDVYPEGNGTYVIYMTSVICRTIHAEMGQSMDFVLEAAADDRPVSLASDFKKALEQNEYSRHMFEMYSYSNKKDIIEWIEDATSESVRASRMERALVKMGQEYLEYLDNLPKAEEE
jgi:hypothetical protein